MARLRVGGAALVLLLGGACGADNPTVEAPPEETAAAVRLVVENYTFPALTVKAGATIQVVNRDSEHHTVTADGGAFDVGPVEPGAPQTLTAPSAPGSYAYACRVHPTMHGTLVVS